MSFTAKPSSTPFELNQTVSILIGACAALVIVFVIIIILRYHCSRRRRQRRQEKASTPLKIDASDVCDSDEKNPDVIPQGKTRLHYYSIDPKWRVPKAVYRRICKMNLKMGSNQHWILSPYPQLRILWQILPENLRTDMRRIMEIDFGSTCGNELISKVKMTWEKALKQIFIVKFFHSFFPYIIIWMSSIPWEEL